MPLPRILIIDDQFGRCGLGRAFRSAVGEDLFTGYAADRRALCANFGLLDITGDIRTVNQAEPLAEAIFCPAQVWIAAAARIENSLELALERVRRGWPFADGNRWALVLVDLRFTYGTLNRFGDPVEGTYFGAEALIPGLRREFGADLPIVVLSSTDREENNITVRRAGALDFIQRLPGAGEAPDRSKRRLGEALYLHGLLPDPHGIVVGNSLAILKMLRQARRGARAAKTILLQGETGTGKGLLARYIHSISDRSEKPFETFNAAFRTGELQADELFGHWKGAFYGANEDAKGVWERADGGTLFIDEVADIDEKVQQRLMPAIEEKEIRRLGHPSKGRSASIRVDVRVVLATNRRLAGISSVKLDFLNRINAFEVEIPALRERMDDLPALIVRLTSQIAPGLKVEILPETMEALMARSWMEGNIRELRNTLEKAIANNPGQIITVADVLCQTDARETSENHEPMRPVEGLPGWQQLVQAMREPVGLSSRQQRSNDLENLAGIFPELVATALAWSLDITKSDKGVNYTAAARFMLGKEKMTTVESKQFIRRILNLDVRDQSVLKHFKKTPLGAVADALAVGKIDDGNGRASKP